MYTISSNSMAAFAAADRDRYRKRVTQMLIARTPELLAEGAPEQVSVYVSDCIGYLSKYGIDSKYHVAWFALLISTFGADLGATLSRYRFIDEAVAEPGATPERRLHRIESYFK